ncbi:MAG: glycosyl transferase group 1 [Frankiales bacterium]|jgi:glycosyltransferase involved in cell wall biosynthesis|nr:glycosyl transferase group 1 [Frankiales bacterium]
MRVGLVLEQCLAPVPGGTGRYSREVAAALARRAPEGSVVAGATAWHREVLRIPGVPAFRLTVPRRALIALWERGIGPSLGGDVVHAPTPLAPPRRRTPLVVTVHDAVPWTHPETLTPRGVRWHRAAIERAARTADVVVVPTHAVSEELRRHVSLGDRVRVIGHGVSADLRVPEDADARAARLQLPEGFLLTVATLEPRKGLSVLLHQLARADAPRVPLLVAGQPGWGGLDPAAEAGRLGLADRVRVLGRVSDEDLAVLMSRATALVVPSRAEGFGLPMLEAMSLGTPVVTSPDAALEEVAGGASLVAADGELATVLRSVLEDASLRERLGAAGRRRAADFTWDGAADALWVVYGEIGAQRA